MNQQKEFDKFATTGPISINSIALNNYKKAVNNSISPTVIEERQMNVVAMDVFSRLMVDRIIFLGTEIDDTVSNIITAQLLFLESTDPELDIRIYLNTPGGSVYSGLAIVDTMNYVSCDVSTLVSGIAASMGFIVAASGTKGKRAALKHSRMLIHQPLGGAYGQASDIEIANKQMQIVKKELANIICETCDQKMPKVMKDMDRDYWMTSTESKKYGAIDEILNKKLS